MNIRVSKEKTPLFDLTSMLAVESLFRDGPKDPWLDSIVSNFTDLFIFSDHVRVTIPFYSSTPKTIEEDATFRTLNLIKKQDPVLIQPVVYRTDEQISLNSHYMHDSFCSFAKWASNNRQQVRQWLNFHRQPWIRDTHVLRFHTDYLYPTQTLMNTPEFNSLVKILSVRPEEVCYTFDLVLRYSLIGQIAGENEHYLAHPIREEQCFPTMRREPGIPPPIPIHIGKFIIPVVQNFTMDEYTAFLYEARVLVRDMGIVNMKPHTIEKDSLRELAARLWLPPKLRSWKKAYGILAGLLTGAGVYPVVGPISAVVGGAVSVAATFWTGNLPRTVARIKWLRWACEWDIEQESRSKP